MHELRSVIDTNILVSSILIASSVSDRAFKKAKNSGIVLFSEETFEELQQVITRTKFDKYVSISIRAEFIARLREESVQIEIIERITACRDSKDDKFLEVAVNGSADYIITGDQDLLVLHPFRDVAIISPAQFLEIG
jgi:uncharacterized protein